MLRLLVSAVFCFVAFGASSASAMPLTEWGISARTSSAYCPSFCTNVDFGTGSLGGVGASFANSDIDDFEGEAHAQGSLAPGGGVATPVMRASAFSRNGQLPSDELGGAFATVFSAEGYTNVSGSAETFTLNIMLTATVVDPTPGDLDTSVRAELVIYEAENFFFSESRATLESEAGAVVVDETVLRIGDGDASPAQGAFTFTLDPGESVYVWALMRAEAERESSFADAFGTLTFDFEDSTGLEVASTVPAPGASILFAGPLALLLGRRWGR